MGQVALGHVAFTGLGVFRRLCGFFANFDSCLLGL